MSINVFEAGLDHKTSESGKPASGSEGGWLKALEKAHFEKQRESMQSTSTGSSNLDSYGNEPGVNDQRKQAVHAFAEQRPAFSEVSALRHVGLASGQVGSTTLQPGVGNTDVADLSPVKIEQVPGTYIPAMSASKAETIQGSQSYRETVGGARPQHVLQKADLSGQSVKLLPVDSGVELVIRSRKDSSIQLASTIKAVQTFLAMNSQKLSSVRVNGEVLTSSSAGADSSELKTDHRMLTINKVY